MDQTLLFLRYLNQANDLFPLEKFDVIIMPGFGERMKTPDKEVFLNVQECLKPLGRLKRTLPVPAGSQWAGSAPAIYEKLGTIDFGIVPGRGVFSHPMGPRAGAASRRTAPSLFLDRPPSPSC